MCDMDMFEKLKKHYFEHGISVRLQPRDCYFFDMEIHIEKVTIPRL